jgi:LAGLIDADG endonuclease
MRRIIKTLGCGNLVRPSGDRLVYGISVSNHKDLYNTIIPFFNLYPLFGSKTLDFQDFSKGLSIFHTKGHLTSAPRSLLESWGPPPCVGGEGLAQIKALNSRMNTFREF